MGAKVAKRPSKAEPGRDEAYLEHVRLRGCCVRWFRSLGKCSGHIRAHHHGKAAGGGGVSFKSTDYRTVPLCDAHHGLFHTGELRTMVKDALGLDVDDMFAEEMVNCLESWLLRDSPVSKILPRLKPSAGGEF
jgi:hypothetical protein